jgi:hypothetical protein
MTDKTKTALPAIFGLAALAAIALSMYAVALVVMTFLGLKVLAAINTVAFIAYLIHK